MTKKTARVDSVSRLIAALPQTIYRAFIDPTSLASWLPPTGMKCQLQEFDPREGGGYRMTLTYEQPEHPVAGKASEHSDVVEVRFVTLVPDQRIVQVVEFESEDPAFAGAMTMTWSLTPVRGGTEVSIRCGNVPEGIRKEDHDQGLRSSLENLAAFTE